MELFPELSSEERQRIYLEEEAGVETRKQLEQEDSTGLESSSKTTQNKKQAPSSQPTKRK